MVRCSSRLRKRFSSRRITHELSEFEKFAQGQVMCNKIVLACWRKTILRARSGEEEVAVANQALRHNRWGGAFTHSGRSHPVNNLIQTPQANAIPK